MAEWLSPGAFPPHRGGMDRLRVKLAAAALAALMVVGVQAQTTGGQTQVAGAPSRTKSKKPKQKKKGAEKPAAGKPKA